MESLNLAEMYRRCVRLVNAGWTPPEIGRLSHFRHDFEQTSGDLPALNLDIRHLECIRWLVTTARLTERMAEGEFAARVRWNVVAAVLVLLLPTL